MAELTTNFNYLQPTSFKLMIDRKNRPNLEFFVQTVQQPAVTNNPAEIPYRNVSSIPFSGTKLTFEELTLQILIDENMESYTEMYKWMCDNISTIDGDAIDGEGHTRDLTLLILSSHNNVTNRVRFFNALPVALGSFPFEASTADIQHPTFPASFRYSHFDIEKAL